MSSPASRKAKHRQAASTAVEAVELLREMVELQRQQAADIAAMRATMEGAFAVDGAPEKAASLIDLKDLLPIKQAAFLAKVSDDTMRRWADKHKLAVFVGGTLYISRSKLLAHPATRRADDA